ncbi:glucoside xylosyltransferase 2 isoform X1 [Salmo salar]|uniref:UDP-D-xylose:beta-D-glucoside alpha-1,3-D-xylosyltransferase n=1 Tax=Salmo salar TaxID=8030 RepID=A0A1S3LCF7_SALSA|nr:glucoside xylosyltransferase 2 isoform X1 [Salmo salar]|eukprot:XP_013988641.1 PREDICTED: glucoside xylosyltransferase 2-like isoform X1 [Salmo salar]
MRIHCKIVVIAVCFGVFLLLYFFGGNAADDPPLKEVEEDNYFPKFSGLRNNVASKLTKKTPDELHIPHKQPLTYRKVSKVASRGGNAIAKSRQRSDMGVGRPASKRARADEVMHLAVVACGNRLDETLTMVKSALLFSIKSIKFHIFAEDPLTSQFEKGFLFQLSQWPHAITNKFQYSIYPITFSVGNAEEWKKLFKPCAAQRLFLPVILKDVDSLLYVDTDVLFLRPMDDMWSFLKAFNTTQLAAMAPEHEIPKIGWYSRFARHPFYGVTGVNSGVMLMNLTRIRSTLFKNSMIPSGLSWEDLLHPLYQKYKNHITWGDQDLLNIIFHYNSECLYTFPCQWNYRPDHCMYGSNCKGAEEEGVSILHGNRGVYHDDKQPAFKVVYDAIHEYPFEDNLFQSLFYPLQTKFLDTVNTLCGRIPQVFLKQVEKSMRTVYEKKVVRHVRPPPK